MTTRSTSVNPPTPPTHTPGEAHHSNQISPPVLEAGSAGHGSTSRQSYQRESKMYSQRFGIVQREIKGPTPKVVIVEDMVREQKIYLNYLLQRREEEKAQEKELDRILEEEKQKKLAEKDKELRLEKQARKQLMNEVMCTRKLQVQEKLQRKTKEEEEHAMEQERINEGLKELNREEKENFARRCDLAREYRKQLQMQIAYQQQAREAEKEEKRLEFEAGIAANQSYLDKIQEILCSHPVLPRNIHPMRRARPNKLPL